MKKATRAVPKAASLLTNLFGYVTLSLDIATVFSGCLGLPHLAAVAKRGIFYLTAFSLLIFSYNLMPNSNFTY